MPYPLPGGFAVKARVMLGIVAIPAGAGRRRAHGRLASMRLGPDMARYTADPRHRRLLRAGGDVARQAGIHPVLLG